MSSAPAWARHLPAGVDHESLDLLEGDSLARVWADRWGQDPDARVLHDPRLGWIRAGQFDEATRVAAGRLRAIGIDPGDRVLFSAESSAGLVVAHAACMRAGIVIVPVNTAYRQREVEYIVRDARPRAAIVDDQTRAGWIEGAIEDVVCLTLDLDLPDGDPGPLDRALPMDPAIIGYTSGTTGEPKGAVLSHGNLLSSVQALLLAWRWQPEDRLVLALPLFHMHGLGVGLHGTLAAGASAILQPGFEPAAVFDAIREHDATLFFGVPTMYVRIVDDPRAREFSALRLCVSGSAPMSAELHASVEAACNQRVLERYGMTETVMLVSNPYDGERRPGTVGVPLPGVDLRLDGAPSAGEPGEIMVRGPNVFRGYWDRPEATAECLRDGWFATGDIGQLDDDGYVTIVGRSKELVITGGYNVYPREVEDVLRSHPSVHDVAVTGTPSAEWGEVVTAWIEPRPGGIDTDDVLEFAQSQLAPYKRPRLVHVLDELPRNALGKVQKHLLSAPGGA